MLFCQNAPFSTTQANTEVLFLLQCMNVEIPCFWEICCATTVNTILCMYKKDAHTFAKKRCGRRNSMHHTTTTEGQEQIKVAFKCALVLSKCKNL